jgi:Protein of unknown function (DUF2510)
MRLADAPPPNGKGDAPPGKYQDPFGSDRLREWDGSRWTDRTQKLEPADARPLSAHTRSHLIVPRPFRFSGTYHVVEENGRELFHVPGPRWFSNELRVCNAEGTELSRLRSANAWFLPFGGYKVFRGDEVVGRVPHGGSISIKSGKGGSTPIAVTFSGGTYAFIRQLSVVARLNYEGKPPYELEIAQDVDIDPVLIVAVSVGIDQVNRAVLTGGG